MLLQILINSSTKLYLDLMGAIIVILLLNNNYTFKSLIIITFLADIIGHWYIGTHLFAAILITFLSSRVTTFFNLSTFLKKNLIVAFFYALFLLIVSLIDLCLHNPGMHVTDIIIEIFIFSPIILKILDNLLIKHTENIIF